MPWPPWLACATGWPSKVRPQWLSKWLLQGTRPATEDDWGTEFLDMKIAEIGKARGLKVIGLETIPQQLQALAAVPEAQQLDMLQPTLLSSSSYQR